MPARHQRVVRGDDYRRIVREGHRVGSASCITHAVLRTQADAARFGFIVSKAVGNAVTRNLVRRRLKAIADQSIHEGFSGADIVFRALPASAKTPFAQLQRDVLRALQRVQGLMTDQSIEKVAPKNAAVNNSQVKRGAVAEVSAAASTSSPVRLASPGGDHV